MAWDVWRLLIRLGVGFMFASSGWGKLGKLPAFIDDFHGWGVSAAPLLAPMTAGVELIAGVLLMVGLVSRLAAGALAGTMVGALALVVVPALGVDATDPTTFFSHLAYTPEFLLLGLLGVTIVTGPGRISVQGMKRLARTGTRWAILASL